MKKLLTILLSVGLFSITVSAQSQKVTFPQTTSIETMSMYEIKVPQAKQVMMGTQLVIDKPLQSHKITISLQDTCEHVIVVKTSNGFEFLQFKNEINFNTKEDFQFVIFTNKEVEGVVTMD